MEVPENSTPGYRVKGMCTYRVNLEPNQCPGYAALPCSARRVPHSTAWAEWDLYKEGMCIRYTVMESPPSLLRTKETALGISDDRS